MCSLITHRGPDEDGFFDGPGVALGMRRLKVIDLSTGRQPLRNEDGSVVVVFNGEIYNFRELRTRLEAKGHQFATRSDTEVIAHAYEEFGDAFPKELAGMFAIALWDQRRRRLILVRDRFGKKPLYYTQSATEVAFASELKCLLAAARLSRELDPAALDQYLGMGYVPAPRTILRDARKLPAGHLLVFEAGALTVSPYWRLEPLSAEHPNPTSSLAEQADQLEALLTAAVEKRLVSDVPIGAFLSGGLDSSVVVAVMARLMREPVRTFTIGFDEPGFSEAPTAERTAHALGTDHRQLVLRPDFEQLLPVIAWGLDEPLGDPSIVPTYYVSRLARERVTVCLTGDGGDELFAGYQRYSRALAEHRYDRLPAGVRKLAGSLSSVLPAGTRGKQRLARLPLGWMDRYAASMVTFPLPARADLYRASWRSNLGRPTAEAHFTSLLNEARRSPLLTALQWTDVQSYLADDILVKVDRMSMLNSLETRAPILDHLVAEWAFRLPPSSHHDGRSAKRVFREVARRLVPDEILHRPKMGFGVPLRAWLRGPLRELSRDALLGNGLARRDWFEPVRLRQLLDRQLSGQFDYAYRVWHLICLELWAQSFLDRPAADLAPPSDMRASYWEAAAAS
jgi:asparagine synthase (glutamine-hydrolysing)